MAETETKKYLVNVESNLEKYAQQAVEAGKKVDQLTIENLKLRNSTTASRAEIETHNAALKVSQKEYTQAKRLVELQTKANNSEANSRDHLSAIISIETARLNKLGDGYTVNAKGQRVISEAYKNQVKNLADARQALISYDQAQNSGYTNVGRYKESLGQLTGQFATMPGPLGNAASSVSRLGTSFKALLANPVVLVITAIIGVFAGLIAIFKKFEPVVEKFERIMSGVKAVFTGLKEGVIGLITGQESLRETFDGLGESMKKAYEQGVKLKQAEQDLEDMNALITVSNAKSKRQIDELLLASKNKTKSEEERMLLINQAILMEEVQYEERKKIADKELEIAQGKITAGKDFTKQELEELNKRGVAYLLELQSRKSITDEEVQDYANALANQENILDESIGFRERAMNRADLLEQQQEEKRQKRSEADKKRADEKRKQAADADKEAQAFIEKEIARMDKEAEDKWNSEVELQRKIYEQNRKDGQKEYDAKIAQEKALADAVIEIHEQLNDSKMRLASSTANFLSSIAGENNDLQNAALIAEKALAIAEVVIQTTKANATIRAMAAASVLPGPGYLVRLAASQAAAMVPININRVAAALDIASIIAATATQIRSNNSSSGYSASGRSSVSTESTRVTAPSVTTAGTSILMPSGQLSQQAQTAAMESLSAQDISDAMSKVTIVTTIEDINAKQKSTNKVVNRSNI
jgi:hypothetical protein